MNNVLRPVRRWSWGWLWLTLACLIGQPLALWLVATIFMPGGASEMVLFASFFVVIEFVTGPIALVHGLRDSLAVISGLPEEDVLNICCAYHDQTLFYARYIVIPLALPAGTMSCLLLSRFVLWRSFTLRQSVVAISCLRVVAHSVIWHYVRQVELLCAALQCL